MQFHLVFTVPQLVLAWLSASRGATPTHRGAAVRWILLLCLVATSYTTPWDNYLVANSVWGYGASRVIA